MSQLSFGRTFLFSICGLLMTLILPAGVCAPQPGGQDKAKPKDTEVWEPEPKVVTPGSADSVPPSDAIVLFDGNNLDQWVNTSDKSPAKWIVSNGVMTVSKAKGAGNIETKRAFHNYQLHIEWKIPENVTGTDSDARQQRGFSGFHRPWRCRVRVADSRFVVPRKAKMKVHTVSNDP